MLKLALELKSAIDEFLHAEKIVEIQLVRPLANIPWAPKLADIADCSAARIPLVYMCSSTRRIADQNQDQAGGPLLGLAPAVL